MARSTVASSGFSRYTKPLDEVATGGVARFTSSALEIVSLVACARGAVAFDVESLHALVGDQKCEMSATDWPSA